MALILECIQTEEIAEHSYLAGDDSHEQGVNALGMIVREREPLNLEMPFGSLDGFITPVNRFFVRGHFAIPQIDVKAWRLMIEDEVETPFELNYDEIRTRDSRTIADTIE